MKLIIFNITFIFIVLFQKLSLNIFQFKEINIILIQFGAIVMQKKVDSIPHLLNFIKEYKGYVFYIGPLFRPAMMAINDFMPRCQMLSCVDPFFGAHPHYKVPPGLENHVCKDLYHCQAAILKNPAALEYMKQKDPRPNIVIGQITSQLQDFCKENDLNYWGISLELYRLLGNKVKLIDILKRAQIPFIPNICSKINSYQQLREISAKLGTSFIVAQNPNGFQGRGTIFIQNENDYNLNQQLLQNGQKYKIMPYRRLKSFAIDGIATNCGTVLGPLLSQLIGHPQLTPRRGGYCGNQLRKSYFQSSEAQMKVRKDIFYYAQKLGDFLYGQYNYRGFFGLDFVVDEDSNEVFVMEINPRITGPCAITYQVYEAQSYKFPLFLFHCLQFMNVKIQLNPKDINEEWIRTQNYQNELSFIVFKNTLNFGFNQNMVPAGLWKIKEEEVRFTGNPEFRIKNIDDDEILFVPDVMTSSAILIIKGRCQDYRFKLIKTFEDLIDKFSKIGRKYPNKVDS